MKAMTAVDKLLNKDKEEADKISDLHTINEDNGDDDGEPVASKQEASEYAESLVTHEFILKECFKMAQGTLRVQNFLLSCLWRRRFLKKKSATVRIQGLFRIALAKKALCTRRIAKKGEARVRQMGTFIKYYNRPEELHES